jgi:predicted ATP-grasp superfamily ATP-dependent carboligase
MCHFISGNKCDETVIFRNGLYLNYELMGKKYNVLVIDDNVVPLSLAVIRCLGALPGLKIHVLSLAELKCPSLRFSRYVSSYRWVKVAGDKQAYEAIRKRTLEVKADVVLPMKERTVRIVAERYQECREFTNLPPMPDPGILEVVRNKWLLYNWLYDNKISNTKPIQYIDLLKNTTDHGSSIFPLMIKPHWGSGGRGISKVDNLEELIQYKPAKEFKAEELLIQPFIPGYDIDFSVLAEKGEVIAYSIQKGFDQHKKFVYSKAIEFLYDDRLYQLCVLLLRKLNYSGIAHLDFRYNPLDDSYNLIDFNARFWSSILGSLHAGINFPWITCQRAMGLNASKTDYRFERYYMTNTIHGLIPGSGKNHQSFSNSEIKYVAKDIVPLLVQVIEKLSCSFKTLLQN